MKLAQNEVRIIKELIVVPRAHVPMCAANGPGPFFFSAVLDVVVNTLINSRFQRGDLTTLHDIAYSCISLDPTYCSWLHYANTPHEATMCKKKNALAPSYAFRKLLADAWNIHIECHNSLNGMSSAINRKHLPWIDSSNTGSTLLEER